VLDPDPEVEPPPQPARLALGLAHDRAHVVGAKPREPLQNGVDQITPKLIRSASFGHADWHR